MSEPTVTSQEGQVQLLQSQESSSSAGSMNIAYRWEQGLFEDVPTPPAIGVLSAWVVAEAASDHSYRVRDHS